MTDDFRTQLESKTDEELLEMLRDRESGEWQPEALVAAAAIVTDRGIALPEAETPATDEAEFVDLVTVATFLTTGEAEPAKNALQAAGFNVLAKDLATVYADGVLAPMLGGVRVQVPAAEAADAAEFLRSANAGELAATVPCPACGSTETGSQHRAADDDAGTAAGTWFRCRACGHEWQ
jgi:DNA-directed RNA polymerase subunit M/transcription elongation factor TFIIS